MNFEFILEIFSCWWFWVFSFFFVFVLWLLFHCREYKIIDKKAFVRHGLLGKWEDIYEHLKNEHPEEYDELMGIGKKK